MRTSRLFAVGSLLASFCWVLAGGCSSSRDNPAGPGPGMAGTSSTSDAQTDGTVSMPDAIGSEGGAANDLNPLCGTGVCLPDSATACRSYQPPSTGGSGGTTGTSGAGGESGQGGDSGGAAGDGGANAGAGGAASAGGAGGEAGSSGGVAGNGGAAGDGGTGNVGPGTAQYSCQVARQNNQPLRQCERAGTGTANAPCFSSADCARGLGCITDGEAGRCLQYCCSADTSCDAGTYCGERQLRQASGNNAEPASVPVCVPADACSLDDQYPCPAGKDCRCSGDTACMVVRDRTTTCITPGTGQQGDACPCAWNHLCSSATNQCVKICHTDPSKDECGTQKCQASAELPQNFGVCVGPLK